MWKMYRYRAGKIIRYGWRVLAALTLLAAMLSFSNANPGGAYERARVFTRGVEFDYIGWTVSALRLKIFEAALDTSSYLTPDLRKQSVFDYLSLVAQIQKVNRQITQVYADPGVADPQQASQPSRDDLRRLEKRRQQVAPLAEAILQSQVSYVVGQLGLTVGGQPIPPVLYHATPLPLALIISPRHEIRQEANLSLIPDLEIDQRAALEDRIDQALDVSSLVVEIGGVGAYPSMIYQTSDLVWLSEVIAHEWVHNWLTLRPLGMNYLTSPELRTINETVASIADQEIGHAVLARYYPELLPPETPAAPPGAPPPLPVAPVFDFRYEMYLTRVQVDELLAQGKIEEAEAYMEQRRQVFWENGYRHLRKLNQAYFAFHGAYASQPGGAAGAKDVVGEAVRQLRAQSASLAQFLERISWVTSFEQLQALIEP
jgi:hypothetical protein